MNIKLTISKEFKVGMLALVSGIMLYYGFRYLRGIDFFSTTKTYYAFFDRIMPNVEASSLVYLNGVAVGRVSEIRLPDDLVHDSRTLVAMEVDENIQLTDKSLALQKSFGIVTGNAIELQVNEGKALAEGDTLTAMIEATMEEYLGDKMETQISPLINNINQLTTTVNEKLKSLPDFNELNEQMLATLQRTDRLIGMTQMQTDSLLRSLQVSSEMLRPILANAETITDSLKVLEVNRLLNESTALVGELRKTTEALNDQKGTAGKLIHDTELYEQLNQMLSGIDTLVRDFHRHPGTYLRPLGAKNNKRATK